MGHHVGHAVGALVDVGISDEQQDPRGRALYQTASGFEHRDTSALRADQRTGYVEAVLGQQVVQVESRDPPRDVGEALPNQFAIFVSQSLQAGIDFAPPAPGADDLLQFVISGFSHLQPQPVVGQDVKSLNVVVRLARHHRMHAAGIVSGHAAQGAAVVGSGIGPKGQVIALRRVTQIVQHHAGLYPGDAALGIDLKNFRQVAGKVEHQRHVAALPGKRRPAAAAQERRAVLPGQ